MTDEMSFPPLLDLSPDELDQQKRRLIAYAADASSGRWASLRHTRRSGRPLVLLAASLSFAAAGVAFSGVLGEPSGASHPRTAKGHRVTSPVTRQGGLRGGSGRHLLPLLHDSTPIAVSDASATLGAPVLLPNTSFVQPADATKASALGDCPLSDASGANGSCYVWISFPAQSLSITYSQPAPADTPGWYDDFVKHDPAAQVVTLDGVSALEIEETTPGPDPQAPDPGSIDFVVGGTRVVVAGFQSITTLEAVAESIISQSGS